MPDSPPDARLTKVWLHEPRGGYGYTLRVPCRVIESSVTGKRLKIEVVKGGEKVTRYVRPDRVVDA